MQIARGSERRVEAAELIARKRRFEFFGRRQMRKGAFDLEGSGLSFERRDQHRGLIRLAAEARDAGVDLDVDGERAAGGAR